MMETSEHDKHPAPQQAPNDQQNPAREPTGEIRQSSETSGGKGSVDSDPAAVPSVDVSAATFSFDAVEGFHASLLDAAPPTIRQQALLLSERFADIRSRLSFCYANGRFICLFARLPKISNLI